MPFIQFIREMSVSPILLPVVLLTLGVIFVNGWTDAPNAIATCVATRTLTPRTAIALASVFNFFGVFVMTLLSPKVAETIYNMVDLGADTREALIALAAAMLSIVVWAVLAWAFGIPTSESHAIIAGLSGAAIAMHDSLRGINGGAWAKVLFGLVFSLAFGFALGYGGTKLLGRSFRGGNRRKLNAFFGKGQIAAAACTAFMHGAQDGQKFMGVFLLGTALAGGDLPAGAVVVPVWLMTICSVVMALGTSVGGMKIIRSVGMEMVKTEKYQGFAADVSAAAGLLVCSLCGLPVSTTHAKTAAVMGAGAAKRFRSVNWKVVKDMALTWLLTFPGCGLIGFLTTKLFVLFF